MLYWILKPLQNIFLRVFYKIEYKGIENVPRNQPVVIATNHVNAFIDPCIVAMLPMQKVRFFARGDVFKGKLVKRILNNLNISPMYRLQEGYGEIKKNDKTFEECRELLANDKVLLLYPEAICILERRLRPLKKGLSRIVFQSAEAMDFKKDILIVPAGVNYTAANKFRSKVFIEFGKPISLKEYEARYREDKVRAINEFTKVLEAKMTEHLVIIKNSDNDKLVEVVEEVFLLDFLKRKNVNPKSLEEQYKGSKELAAIINYIDEHNSPMLISLKEKALDYNRRVKANDLRDHLLHVDHINKLNMLRFIMDAFLLWLGLPIYAFGMLVNSIPYLLAKNLADQKVRHVEFYASFYANLGMIFWLLFYPIQLIGVGLLFRSWPFLGVYALLVPLTGYFTLVYAPILKKIMGRLRLLRMVRKDRKIIETLIGDRNEVMAEIEEMLAYYSASKKGK